MHSDTGKAALVTGASSGLGFETAVQLAEQNHAPVVVTARTADKAATTKARLEELTGKRVFETLVLDLDSLASVEAAAGELARLGHGYDTVVLNAGIAPPPELRMSEDGFDAVVSSSLIGHHVLTMRMLEGGLLSDKAHIVIAGSEAARGDFMGFVPLDVRQFAADDFAGDLESAIESQIYMRPPASYDSRESYATAKMFVAWWSAELARRLPEGMKANAVSPGSTPDTDAQRNAPAWMRYLMVPVLKLVPGMAHSVEMGASRYLAVANTEATGKFYASPPKKVTGELEEVTLSHIQDREGQHALWSLLTKVTGAADYPVSMTDSAG